MVEQKAGEHLLIGRETEFDSLKNSLANAKNGKGSTVLISGEPGIGKTRLVEAFRDYAATKDVKVLAGAASPDSAQPYLLFSKALGGEMDSLLFEERESTGFVKIFAINRAGILVAQASSDEGDMDADIFAGMLSAVQNFVSDSLGRDAGENAGLGRLEYGDMKILIEHGKYLFLTGVLAGPEHPDMKGSLGRTLRRIEINHGAVLAQWSGKVSEAEPIGEEIARLTDARFLARRDLEGVKLDNERVRIADRVLECLASLSSAGPLLLIFEDLHWADESALFTLAYLARNIRESRTMILCSARPGDSPQMAKFLKGMECGDALETISLGALEKGDFVSLIDALYSPNDFPGQFKEEMLGTCSGNPFFVIELLNQMAMDGHIKEMGGAFVLEDRGFALPNTIHEVILMRLDSLDPEAMTLAEYASCAGREFDCAMLDALSMVSDAEAAFGKLAEAQIMLRFNGTAGFCHALFRESIYNTVSPRWKAVHHRAIGEYYENAYAGREDEVLYELARHFFLGNEPSKSLGYSIKAGEKAEASYAAEKAVEFYGMALARLENLPGSARNREMEIDIGLRQGALYSLMGSYREAIARYNKLINIIETKNKKAEMHRLLAEVYHETGDLEKCIEESDKGLAILGDEDSEERSVLLGAKSWSFILSEDYTTAVSLLTESLAIAERLGFDKQIGLACHRMGAVQWASGKYDKALEYLQKASDIREKMGDEYNLALTANNLGLVYSEIGEQEKALKHYQITYDVVNRLGDKFTIGMVLSNMGLIYQDFGEMDRALGLFTDSLKIKRKIGDRYGILMCLHNIALVELQQGKFEDSILHLSESMELSTELGVKQAIIHNACALAEAYIELGEFELAHENAKNALAMSEGAGAKLEEAMVRNAMGTFYRKKEDYAMSLAELEKAEKIADGLGNKGILAQIKYSMGMTLKCVNEEQNAEARLREALEMFSAMRMKLWMEKCLKALGKPGH